MTKFEYPVTFLQKGTISWKTLTKTIKKANPIKDLPKISTLCFSRDQPLIPKTDRICLRSSWEK